MTAKTPERRQGNLDILEEIQKLGGKIDQNTSATHALGDRVGRIEIDIVKVQAFSSELRGGVKTGRWLVGTFIAIGLGFAGMFSLSE